MATDRDDEIARRYRALATEEPGAALDAAILAKSRRAVGARPGGFRRWGPPLSIAAVLVLASGLVIRMQAEKPGIETSAPVRQEPAAPAAPASIAAEPPATAADVAQPLEKAAPAASPRSKVVQPRRTEEEKRVQREVAAPPSARDVESVQRYAPDPDRAPASPMRESLQSAPVSTPPPPAPYSPAAAPQRAPMQLNVAPPAAAGAAAANAPAEDAARASAAPAPAQAAKEMRLKRESQERTIVPTTPESLLDRIAELRAAGRDDEADRALEDFRRAYPGYRFSDAQWDKVRRRAP